MVALSRQHTKASPQNFYVLLLLLLCSLSQASPPPTTTATGEVNINCGSAGGTHGVGGEWWGPDEYFRGGEGLNVELPKNVFVPIQDQTMRVFDVGSESCYDIPLQQGRHIIRMGFHLLQAWNGTWPSFAIQVEGTFVEKVRMQHHVGHSYSSEYIFTLLDSTLSICFIPVRHRAFVNSIQVRPLDPAAYNSLGLPQTSIIVNRERRSVGGRPVPRTADRLEREWVLDDSKNGDRRFGGLRLRSVSMVRNSSAKISGVDEPPFYLPALLLQWGRESGPSNRMDFSWRFPAVSRLHSWVIILHFCEIMPGTRVGDRVFDVLVNGVRMRRVDVLRETGGQLFTPFALPIFLGVAKPVFMGPGSLGISIVRWRGSRKNPLVNAIELFEVIRGDSPHEQLPQGLLNSLKSVSTKKGSIAARTAGIFLAVGAAVLGGVLSVLLLVWRRQHRARQQRLALLLPPPSSSSSPNIPAAVEPTIEELLEMEGHHVPPVETGMMGALGEGPPHLRPQHGFLEGEASRHSEIVEEAAAAAAEVRRL